MQLISNEPPVGVKKIEKLLHKTFRIEFCLRLLFLLWASLFSLTPAILFADQSDPILKLRQRVAVVIGNSEYTVLPTLDNAVNDSFLVSEYLANQGYRVIHRTNLTKSGFSSLLADFVSEISPNSQVIFYYAGHGFQVGSENYIVPVNSQISSLYDVPFESVSLKNLVAQISTRADLQIFFLDSCRNNPFINEKAVTGFENISRTIEAGFSFQPAPINSLISFSTSPGSIALDGRGKNSPYTQSLVNRARLLDGSNLNTLLSQVRKDVYELTDGLQVTWESSSLLEPFVLSISQPTQQVANSILPDSLFEVTSKTRAPSSQPPDSEIRQSNLSLSSRFEKEVNIGASISRSAPQNSSQEITLTEAPRHGYLGLANLGVLSLAKESSAISALSISALKYFPNIRHLSSSEAADVQFQDTFVLKFGTESIRIILNLHYDPCDLSAGGILDPQGVGVSIYNHEIVPTVALKACRIAVERHPEIARFHYQLFRALRANRIYSEAEDSLNHSLKLGHIRANLGMGHLILQGGSETGGFNRVQATDETLKYYKIGHDKGDPLASYSLGRQYLRYNKDPHFQAIGYELLTQSKDAGNIGALTELGRYFLTTKGEMFNAERGLRYIVESASLGNTDGQNSLGLIYKDGLGGIPINTAKAVELLRTAAENGHPIAPTNLGRIYASGALSSPDYTKALEWYDMGLRRGDPWAGTNGAWIILNRLPPGYRNFDGIVRAAKASVMTNPRAAKEASKLLEGQPENVINAGTQKLLNELGADLVVDGSFGKRSADAFDKVVSLEKGTNSHSAPLERLLSVAEVFWEQNTVRSDLY